MADAQGRGRGRGRRDPNRNQRGGDDHLDQADHGGGGQNQWAPQQFGPPPTTIPLRIWLSRCPSPMVPGAVPAAASDDEPGGAPGNWGPNHMQNQQLQQQGGGPGQQFQGQAPPQMQMQGSQGQASLMQSAVDNNRENNNQTQQQKKKQPQNKNKNANKAKDSTGSDYSDVTCYTCGEPEHHKAQCPKPPSCFICKMVTHKVEDCPVRKKPRNCVKYVGSAASGLGFFKIDVPDVNDQHVGNKKNVGIVYIEAGQVTKEELAHNFSVIYKTNWPWHIRMLDSWIFVVKFPPHIPVATVAGYPNFGLPETEGVSVNVEVWKGEMEFHAELQSVWLQLRGVAPAWAEWSVLEQIASVLGTLINVDWQGNFKSFFEVVRIKIRCKDFTKIPAGRIFGIGDKLYKIKIVVEPPVEDLEQDDLLDEDTEKNKEKEPLNNTNSDDGAGGSHHTAKNSSSQSGGNGSTSGTPHQTKQNVLAYLQQLQDPISLDESFKMLQDMEIGDDDEEDNISLLEEQVEVVVESESLEEVIFSPSLATNTTHASPILQKWGPVQAQRKSSRIDIGGRIIMEIAMGSKKVQNLEEPKGKHKDLVAGLEDPQEVDDSVLRGLSRENAGDTTLDILHTQKPTPIDSGVKRNLMGTGGATHDSSYPKLGSGACKGGFQSTDSSRPSDPS
uniref:CCHC-type domain-containing protein n=1 Tax=Triticum urartu TaxID=4572 RepID=A0A8R7Q0Z2_TRIUA